MNKFICCPECNYQYLPGEIFDPKYFLGQPKNIIRNSLGEILGYEGIKMDTEESFVCENCGREFKVTAKINLSVINEEEKIEEPRPSIRQLTLF